MDQTQKNKNLYEACLENKLEEVKYLLREGADVNARNCDVTVGGEECTPLHAAAFYDRPQVLKTLLEAGADVNAVNEKNSQPLHAILEGYFCNSDSIDLLIKAGADINHSSDIGSPITIAASKGFESEVQKLMELGVNINMQDYLGKTPLHYQAYFGNEKTVQKLIEAGANVNVLDSKNESALHSATMKRDWEGHEGPIDKTAEYLKIIEVLINAGADINAQDNSERTPLHKAVILSEVTCLTLLKAGANVNIQDRNGDTPLHLVAKDGRRTDVAKLLIENGAQLDTLNHMSETPEDAAWNIPMKERLRDYRITKEKADLEKEGPQNLPDRPTPRISRGRL